MRRAGLVLLAIGLGGFLVASGQHARFEEPEGLAAAVAPSRQRLVHDVADTARWLLVGTAVIGLVFTVLPGKSS